MRKVIVSEIVSLDGVFEAPDQWHFPYFDEEMGQEIGAAMAQADAMPVGRVLYDEWADFWPQEDPGGEPGRRAHERRAQVRRLHYPGGAGRVEQLYAGPEVGYIVRGDVAMEFDDRPTLTLRAGDPFMIRGASSTTRGTSGPPPRRGSSPTWWTRRNPSRPSSTSEGRARSRTTGGPSPQRSPKGRRSDGAQ